MPGQMDCTCLNIRLTKLENERYVSADGDHLWEWLWDDSFRKSEGLELGFWLCLFSRDLRLVSPTLPPGALLRGGNWPVPYHDVCICSNKRPVLAGGAVTRSRVVRFPVAFWKELAVLECPALSPFAGAPSSRIFWSFLIYKKIPVLFASS